MSRGSGERGGGVGSGSGGVGSGGVYRPTCGWAYHALPREGSSSSPVMPNCLSDASDRKVYIYICIYIYIFNPLGCPVRAVAQRLAWVGFHRRVFDCTPPHVMQTGTSSGCGSLTEGQEGGCVRHGGGSLSFGVKRSLRRTLFSWSTTSRHALTFTVRGHWHRNTPLATRSGSSCEVED